MNISKQKPVIKAEFLEKYNELHKDICFRLSHINTTITILEKILQSPFKYFPQSETIFWQTVCWNFVWISVVLIHAILNDQGSEKHTLPRFKNRVSKWLKDSEKIKFAQILKKIKFEKATKNIRNKIFDIRNKELAHRLFDNYDQLSNAVCIKVSEIRNIYNLMEELFNACSFSVEYDTTLYPMGEFAGKPIEKDIDKFIDLVVKNSNWLNKPEIMEEHWSDMRQDTSEEELRDLNTWREKFNLPPA